MEDQGVLSGLIHFANDVFERMYVRDPEVKKQVARLILEKGDLMNATGSKFDVQALLNHSNDVPELQDTRPVVNIRVGLSMAHKNVLLRVHPDLSIRFIDAPTMPHGLPHAGRICCSTHLIHSVPVEARSVIDFGGNHTMYDQQKYKFEIHVCLSLEGQHSMHRFQQKEVAIANGKQFVDYCTEGLDCRFQATHGVSTHTLPRYDPASWVGVFRKHGMLELDGMFHYDAMLDTEANYGFIVDAEMHWRRKDGMIEFYFDNDSSFAYKQRDDWTRKYANHWYDTADDWDYVIEYRVLSFNGGLIKSRMTRLAKNTIESFTPEQPVRWIGGEDTVLLPIPEYDPSTGYADSDPRGYNVSLVSAPMSTYNFAFMKGFANDTARPDKPLTRDEVAGFVRVFNHQRTLNGTNVTGKVEIPSKMADKIATGVYIAVVFAQARNQVVMSKFSEQMIRVQRRWGSQGLWSLMANCTKMTALAPFMLLSKSLQDAVDVVAMHMKATGFGDRFVTVPEPAIPYIYLPAHGPVEGGYEDPELIPHQIHGDSEAMNMKRFYMACRAEMPDEIREKLEGELFNGVVPPEPDAPPTPPPVPEEAGANYPDANKFDDSLFEDITERKGWYDEFDKIQDAAPSWAFEEDFEPEVGTPEQVQKYATLAMMEYALHSMDIHIGTVQKTLEFLSMHWKGDAWDDRRIKADNVQKEVEAVYYRVVEGYVQGVDGEINRYDVLVDPHTRAFLPVQYKTDGAYVGETSRGVVYALKYLRIFNGEKIAKSVHKLIREKPDVSNVRLELVDGIAGSGKTRECTRSLTHRDMFVTGPRAGARRIAVWVKKQPRFQSYLEQMEPRVRTSDSAVMHKIPGAQVLNVDEGLMQHAGVFWVLAAKSRCKVVKVTGDNAQIPLIDRGSGYGRLVFARQKYWHAIKYLDESSRMPQDATRVVRKFYPKWRQSRITTSNPVRRSLEYHWVQDANAPEYSHIKPYEHGIAVLQGDKALQVAKPMFEDGKLAVEENHGEDHPVRPILSTHESQGDTYPVSRVFRLNPHSSSVFDSTSHRYVTLSRHELKLVYTGVAPPGNDKLAQDIISASSFTDEELDEVYVGTSDERKQQLRELAEKANVNVHF